VSWEDDEPEPRLVPFLKKLAAWATALGVLTVIFLYVSAASQRAWEAEGSSMYSFSGDRVEVGDGLTVRVRCVGSGPVVVVEASGLGGVEQADRLLERLAPVRRACAYDRLGFGASDTPPAPPSFTRLVDVLETVVDHARRGQPSVTLVGSSYGGLLTYGLARRAPGKVSRLVMLDAISPAAFSAMEAPWVKLDASLQKARDASRWGLLRRLDPLGVGSGKAAWLMYRERTWASVQALLATRHEAPTVLASWPPLHPSLRLVVIRHQRVGDLLGSEFSPQEHEALEPSWQAAQQRLADEVPGTTVQVAETSGHLVVEEAAEVVALELVK
jgi:pimeloyl-ACP methyl ester carboxylesterase